jgi:hypothetical protein
LPTPTSKLKLDLIVTFRESRRYCKRSLLMSELKAT